MNTVRVDTDPLLYRLGDATARLWGEINYERRQQFFQERLTPGEMKETGRKYYYKYRDLLKGNASQVIRKNDGDWRSFFKPLELKKQKRLPPHIRKILPPGNWKDRALRKRRLIVTVGSDRYYNLKVPPFGAGMVFICSVSFCIL
jgi:putative transposase